MASERARSPAGDAEDAHFCHISRDLSVGSVGGDVECLQRLLEREAFSHERPSGTFTRDTARGVERWINARGWTMERGSKRGRVDARVRELYGEVRVRAIDVNVINPRATDAKRASD